MKVYISGPMTGLPDLNFPAFNRAAEELRAAGYEVRAEGFEVVNPAELNPDPNTPYSECMRKDLRALLDCDAIALLPGWENSRGAKMEFEVAQICAMKVIVL